MALPANTAADLRTIVPEELLGPIAAAGLDLDAVSARVRANGILPEELFRVESNDKRYRVWLEESPSTSTRRTS